MRTHTLVSLVAAVSLFAGACAGAEAVAPDGGDDGEIVVDPGTDQDGGTDKDWDEFPTDKVREDARGFLGMYADDLPDEVRVARRGEEEFMLTEDYVLGRSTVELDLDAGRFRVVSVTIELPDGPETFVLEAS